MKTDAAEGRNPMTTRPRRSTRMRKVRPLALLLIMLAAGCADLESVTNLNDPGRDAALGSADAIEALVAGSFETWHDAQYQFTGPSLFLSAASFQYACPWAGVGREIYSRIPRVPIENDPGSFHYAYHAEPWNVLYSALSATGDGLGALETSPEVASELGTAEHSRLMAFARFVQGVSHGSLALLYDRAIIRDEATDLTSEPRLVPYDTVLAAALDYLAEAASLAEGHGWTIPESWMSVEVPADQLARLAHSYSARFRAAVARTPAERAAVDWDAVIADVDAGITGDWVMDMDPYRYWYAAAVDYGTYPGWAGSTYFILGLADQSGSYQRWLDRPVMDRIPNPDDDRDGVADPILVVTPDTRFPQGSTVAEQEANPGSLYVIPEWGIQNVWKRPDRGTWRWGWYWHIDTRDYTFWEDFHWPEITAAEMRLLKAEALLRTGDAATAASLVNVSRTAAGLSPTDAIGTNDSCVPRLPDGTCGGLMEMLKWEKRLETHYKGLHAAPWYFDGRGWGDLYRGTYLQLPVPCRDLEIMDELPCYTYGGPEDETASPGSVYDWPYEGP